MTVRRRVEQVRTAKAALDREQRHQVWTRRTSENALKINDFHIAHIPHCNVCAGTINAAPVYPREVVRRALLHNAAAVILSHNHPSGDPEPSGADTRITDELQQALALVDVRLLDHFVVGEGRPVSFAERGLLSPPQPRLFG